MVIWSIAIFILGLIGLFLCFVFLRRLRSVCLSKSQAIRNSQRLIANSGILAASIYGFGLSLPDPAVASDFWQAVNVYGRTIVQGAFWLVSVVFAGVGVNALSDALSRPHESDDPPMEPLIGWLPKKIQDQLES